MAFKRTVRVSALKDQNVESVLDAIKEFLPLGPPFYDEDTLTDQPERQIAAEIIREKALRLLKDEVPHGIAVTIEGMKMRKQIAQQPKKSRHYHPPKKNRALDEAMEPLGTYTEEDEYDPDGIMDIEATIICEKDSHKGIVIGKGGSMLKKIGSAARKDIEDMVGCQVNLQLFVKVRRDWRDDKFQMKNFGYDYKDLK